MYRNTKYNPHLYNRGILEIHSTNVSVILEFCTSGHMCPMASGILEYCASGLLDVWALGVPEIWTSGLLGSLASAVSWAYRDLECLGFFAG